MKAKIFTPLSVLTLSFGVLLGVHSLNNEPVQEVEGYDVASLEKNIDLNDCTDSEIQNYYKALNDLPSSERQGTNLLKNLKPILRDTGDGEVGQQYFQYDAQCNN